MIVIKNKIIPFGRFYAINLFGIMFQKDDGRQHSSAFYERTVYHEKIHSAQMRELLFVFFYIIYFLEWIIKALTGKDAYHRISFEKEAHQYQTDYDYLKRRKHFAQWRKSK